MSTAPQSPLPHWTEPPSGEVPRILANGAGDDEAGEGDDLEAWSSFATGPAWRSHASDWDQPDFDDVDMAHDDETRVGALDESSRSAADDFFGEHAVGEERPRSRLSARDLARRAAGARGSKAAGGRSASFGDRDVRTAVATGLGLAALAFVAFAAGPAATAVVVGVVLVLTAAEFFNSLRRGGHHPATLLGLVATAGLVGAAYWRGEAAYPLVIALTVVFGTLWYLTGVSRAAPSVNLGVTLLGVGWVGVLGSFGALLLTFPDRQGIAYLLGAVVATAAHDVGSLVAGRARGRSAMAPTISPHKTWEGLAGGTVAAVAVSAVVLGVFPGVHPWSIGTALALGAVVSVMAPLGDLAESLIKRDLGVKDMGRILPGHGGLMDRFDALLFVLPATYYLVLLLEIGL